MFGNDDKRSGLVVVSLTLRFQGRGLRLQGEKGKAGSRGASVALRPTTEISSPAQFSYVSSSLLDPRSSHVC
jgi:hypothetical protein